MKDNFEYKLGYPIEYHAHGQLEQATSLKILAPNRKNFSSLVKIKQMFLKSMIQAGNSASDKEKEEIAKAQSSDDDNMPDGKTALSLMYVFSDDVMELFKELENIFLSGCCEIDHDVKLNRVTYEKIHQADIEGMTREYFDHFLIPSWGGASL